MANQDLTNTIVDLLTIRDLDMHGRRVKNAGNSIDPNDYVTRRELNAAQGGSRAYSLIISGTLAIGTDIAPRLYIPADGTISTLRGDLKYAAMGGPVIFEVYMNVLFLATITIPAGSTAGQMTSNRIAALRNLKSGNFLRVDITNVGPTYPGGDLTITLITD